MIPDLYCILEKPEINVITLSSGHTLFFINNYQKKTKKNSATIAL